MGFLDLFRSKKSADPDKPRFVSEPNFDARAVLINLDWRDAEEGSKLPELEAMIDSQLGLLTAAGKASKKGPYSYEIFFKSVATLDGISRELFELRPQLDWKVDVRVGGVIGRGDPKLHLVFTDPEGTYDAVGRGRVIPVACGFWSFDSGKLIVLPEALLNLRARIEEGPDKLGDDQQAAVFRYVAQVKRLAIEAQRELGKEAVELDGQLQKEDFIAAERVRTEIEQDEDGGLNLFPTVQGLDDENSQRELLGARQGKELFTRRQGEKTTRVALSPQARREVNRVRKRHRVPPEDIRRFVSDPRAYLQPPEELAEERLRIAQERGIPIEEVEESSDFDPDSALELDAVEKFLEEFDVRLYGDRVIGVEAKEVTPPDPDNARSIDLGDWFGEPDGADDPPEAPASPNLDGRGAEESDEVAVMVPEQDQPLPAPQGEKSRGAASTADKPSPSETSESAKGLHRPRLITLDNDEAPEFVLDKALHHQLAFEEYGGEPRLFKGDLIPPFQTQGYAWLRGLQESTDIGGLLADDMGMGKTVQVIALLSYLAEVHALSPALLVIPKSTMQNWQNEIRKFCKADLRLYQHLGTDRYRDVDEIIDHDIILTTYSTLRNDQTILGQIRFTLMICDEAQKIKNYTSGRASACRAMNAGFRLALTATPVENGLIELWSIFDFCQPGHLNSMAEFKERFVTPIESGNESTQERAAKVLQREMYPHFLRRTKEQHLKDKLPQKYFHRATVSMTAKQLKKYEMVRQWYSAERGKALGAIQAMLRICAHPDAISDESEEKMGLPVVPLKEVLANPKQIVADSAKFQFVLNELQAIEQKGERAILFSSLRSIQAMLTTVLLRYFDLQPMTINGDIDATKRQDIVNEFNESPGFNVIILSPKAAGVGINVTGANHVFHVTREWNPAIENQATDRAYRIGQTKDVHVHIPITKHPNGTYATLDERLDDLLSAKREIADNTIVPRGMGKVSSAELEEGI